MLDLQNIITIKVIHSSSKHKGRHIAVGVLRVEFECTVEISQPSIPTVLTNMKFILYKDEFYGRASLQVEITTSIKELYEVWNIVKKTSSENLYSATLYNPNLKRREKPIRVKFVDEGFDPLKTFLRSFNLFVQ